MTDIAEPYTIYFAGQLFDHKHLAGNALLAAHIDDRSQGRYRCVLPQDLEQRGVSPMEAVVEYMYAKMLDIPCVILRTDFRYAGDQKGEGDPWNLMASYYPRAPVLFLDGMQWYQDALAQGGSAAEVSARYHRRIAAEVVTLLDEVRATPPILEGGRAGAEREYRWALRMAGGSLTVLADDAEYIRRVVSRKIALGLLPQE